MPTDGNFRVPRPATPLAFTGERMTSAAEGQIEFEHYHRYCLARDLCQGRDVLDVASGEGYGTALLAQVCRTIVGVEIDAKSVAHAEANYQAGNLRFLHGDALDLPLQDASVDVVVCFETLEHVASHERFIGEVRRVLRQDGLFIVSTPDRTVYSAPGSDPNPYHVLELTDPELRILLGSHFTHVEVMAQRPMLGSVVASSSGHAWRSFERRGPDIIEASSGLARAHYLLGIASDAAIPAVGSSVYLDWRRVHDVVQSALKLPAAEAQIQVFVGERDVARQEAAAAALRLTEVQAHLAAEAEAARRAAAQARLMAEEDAKRLAGEQSASHAAQLAAAQAQIHSAQEAGRVAAEQAASATRERDEARAEAAQANRRLAELQADLQRRQHEWESSVARAHDAARLAAARSHQTLHALRAQLERAKADAEQARRWHEAVIYSTSWRLLAPLRAIGNRLPGPARLVRRAAKLVWWTVTFQIGTRIMLRRRQRAEPVSAAAIAAGMPPAEVWPGAGPAPSAAAQDIAAPGTPPAPSGAQTTIGDACEAAPGAAPREAAPALRPVTREHRPNPDGPQQDGPEQDGPGQPGMEVAARDDLRRAFQTLHRDAPIHFAPVTAPDVSVIIPVYKGLTDLENCLRSLALSIASEPSFEVVLVDDCPAEPVLWALPDSGGMHKISNAENLGFLLTCNKGAMAARGRIVCFLNSDTIVYPGWLRGLVDALDDMQGVGLAGGMLLNPDGTVQDAGWRMLANGWGHPIGRNGDPRDGSYTYRRAVDCVSGACFALRTALFHQLGGFDALYAPAFYEEFDLAFRARARGLKVVYAPQSRVVHVGSASYGAARRDQLSGQHHAIFVERFAAELQKHPWDTGDEFILRHGTEAGPVILVVDYGVPQPNRHAGDVTMSRYLALLAIAGWRVVFGPKNGLADGPAADALQRQGIELIRQPVTIEEWLARHGGHVRHVWLARPDIAEALIGPVRTYTTAPVSYYPHDLHHVRLSREAELRGCPMLAAEAARMRAQELAVLSAVDHVTSPGDVEAAQIRLLVPGAAVHVLPPYFYEAADIVSYDLEHFDGLYDVVFVGGFPHTPNVDAAIFTATEIMPAVWDVVPRARLVLVGYAPPPEVWALAGPRVVVTGQVPAVEPFLEQARVVLAALRFGAGVKGKVVDALRLGVPTVTTPVGAEGIGIVPGRDALVAADAAGLARHVIDLFHSADTCAALSAAGADLIRNRFSRRAARNAIAEVFPSGCCAVCGSAQRLASPEGQNFRESFVCRNCFALGRTEALGRVMLSLLAADGAESLAELARRRPPAQVHEFGFVGAIADTWRAQDWFSVSEFFDAVQPGEAGPNGVRCENLTSLTFADESFDLVISQDVMQHLPDPERAFAETARVLRPGGSHVFTIPLDQALPKSVARARLDPDGLTYLLPPVYRDDPVRAEGALVFTDFGRDLAAILERAGLRLVEHNVSAPGGAQAQHVCVYQAVKPAAGISERAAA
jgi:GT2 family glycosyltransferase/ubiquinone/menaquinone biosynthesis C-methylase UbiE/glycosyltransferase involved in cell wall biosynthesis